MAFTFKDNTIKKPRPYDVRRACSTTSLMLKQGSETYDKLEYRANLEFGLECCTRKNFEVDEAWGI